jgi:hypothetical protein
VFGVLTRSSNNCKELTRLDCAGNTPNNFFWFGGSILAFAASFLRRMSRDGNVFPRDLGGSLGHVLAHANYARIFFFDLASLACGDQLVVVHFRFCRFDLLWL